MMTARHDDAVEGARNIGGMADSSFAATRWERRGGENIDELPEEPKLVLNTGSGIVKERKAVESGGGEYGLNLSAPGVSGRGRA